LDKTVKLRDVATGRTRAVFESDALAVAFLSGGQTLVTLSTNYSLRFWDLASQTVRAAVPLARKAESIGWATLSPDGKILASGGSRIASQLTNNIVTWWNVTNGEVLATFAHEYHVRYGTFAPDGRSFAMASDDRTASIWEVTTRARRALLTGHKGTVWWVAFSPDSKMLATSSYDDTAKLWNVSTGTEVATLTGHRGAAFGMAFSPDGKTLAVCSGEGNVKLWNMATYREVAILRQWKAVGFVPFSSDGKAVETVKAASFVVFSPDGTSAATVYEHDKSGSVQLWNAPLAAASDVQASSKAQASEK
jgi:WD40 repeat protein